MSLGYHHRRYASQGQRYYTPINQIIPEMDENDSPAIHHIKDHQTLQTFRLQQINEL